MTLELYITSHRKLRVQSHPQADDGVALSGPEAARIQRAFEKGSGTGLLHLATLESRALTPALGFARSFAQRYFTELCHLSDPDEDAARTGSGRARRDERSARPGSELAARSEEPAREWVEAPDRDELSAIALSAPPMLGLEYLDATALEEAWHALDACVRAEIAAQGQGVRAYLKEKNPEWRLVGRVAFHLAENKNDEAHPFAFLATYASGLTERGTARHVPLGRALEEYAGASNRKRLLALLTPIRDAAEHIGWVNALVQSGDLYHPLAWTPAEAYRLLRDVPALEASGLAVRIPNWWKANRPPRPQVTVRLGERGGAGLGADALLDFSVTVGLGGEMLTEAEKRELLGSAAGLVRLRGQWVEADGAQLAAALEHWKRVERAARAGGVTFHEGMRLLAGMREDTTAGTETARHLREWSGIQAGSALREVLARLRSPEGERDLALVGLRATLRPYQLTGVKWLRLLMSLGLGACLADDMGLGKTLQVLALLLHLRAEGGRPRVNAAPPSAVAGSGAALASGRAPSNARPPSLIIAPTSLIANWRAEIERFAPELACFVAHSSECDADLGDERALEASLTGMDLAITTYGMVMRLESLRRRRWHIVVLDEAQAIKNPGSQQARAVKALECAGRIVLTGTPIENRVSDLWSLFDFLNPGLLGEARAFARLAKQATDATGAGYAPLRRLVQPYILRRLKTDPRVIADLPSKTEVRAFCSLTREQAALYERCVRELAERLADSEGIQRRGLVLSSLLQLKQICNHPAQWQGQDSYAADRSGKFERLTQLCEELAERQERVLVFTQFREIVEPLALRLAEVFGRPGLTLHGGTAVAKRRVLVEQFQREDAAPFFVLSLKAGGFGLNLTAASQVIHFDRWWNPAVENQATDRAFRIGQKRNVLVHKFVCRGTLEEKIDALIESKSSLARELIDGGGEQRLTEMSDGELLDLVRLDIHKACEA